MDRFRHYVLLAALVLLLAEVSGKLIGAAIAGRILGRRSSSPLISLNDTVPSSGNIRASGQRLRSAIVR